MMYPGIAVRTTPLSAELTVFAIVVHSHPAGNYDCSIVAGIGFTFLGLTIMFGIMED